MSKIEIINNRCSVDEILISVVIPAYNSNNSLRELCQRLVGVFENTLKEPYEIIFVDDNSSDNTWELLNDIYQEYENVKIIRLTKNFGQQCATLCGMFKARGQVVITMDDDLQHRPEDIPLLLEKINDGYDIVMAHFVEKKHSLFKRLSSKLMNHFNNILIGKPQNIYLSSYRAITRKVVEQMQKISTSYPFIPALLFAVTDNIVNVRLTHYESKRKRTTYSLKKYLKIASNLLINNSSLLLKYTGILGVFSALVSFIIVLVLIARKIFLGSVMTGWTSLIASIYLIGGLILFSLGVIGEYLIRILIETTDKPYYFIKEEKL